MHSQIYRGHIHHARYKPFLHHFSYPLFMMYLDLDELDYIFKPYLFWSINRPNLASFRRNDHLGNNKDSLKEAVRKRVKDNTGIECNGAIRLLTHLRYFGYGFNPVSFYFCFDQSENIVAIVAEVNNTPWREQHIYVLPVDQTEVSLSSWHFTEKKAFHVSPFMEMDMNYSWHIHKPDKTLNISIQNFQQGKKIFDANLGLEVQPINSKNLALTLLQFPVMSINIVRRIYWQALKLWLKGAKYIEHPDTVSTNISKTYSKEDKYG